MARARRLRWPKTASSSHSPLKPGRNIIFNLPTMGCADMDADRFSNPSREFGPMPFWWWVGDPLDCERLLRQLDTTDSRK